MAKWMPLAMSLVRQAPPSQARMAMILASGATPTAPKSSTEAAMTPATRVPCASLPLVPTGLASASLSTKSQAAGCIRWERSG